MRLMQPHDWLMKFGITLLCVALPIGMLGVGVESERVMFAGFIVLTSGMSLLLIALLIILWGQA